MTRVLDGSVTCAAGGTHIRWFFPCEDMIQFVSARFQIELTQLHIGIELPSEPDTISVPLLENAAELTEPVWPSKAFMSAPVDASHTRTDSSSEPDTIRVPSLENATE